MRFTAKGDTLYAIVFAWPETGEVAIQSLGSALRLYPREIGGVQLLGSKEPVAWTRDEAGLRAKLPATRPCDSACVLKVVPKR